MPVKLLKFQTISSLVLVFIWIFCNILHEVILIIVLYFVLYMVKPLRESLKSEIPPINWECVFVCGVGGGGGGCSF